jgi:DNA-binding transcriptional ArsR family regulator
LQRWVVFDRPCGTGTKLRITFLLPAQIYYITKIFSNKFAQSINCIYIAVNQLHINMRRDIFQAIADPTRRAILVLLALGAMTPNAVAEHFESTRQTISKHIHILTECEVLIQKKTGREIYYHVNPEKMKEIDIWLERFRKLWETRFDQLDNLLKDL